MLQFTGGWASELDTVGVAGQAAAGPGDKLEVREVANDDPLCVFLQGFDAIKKGDGVAQDLKRVRNLEKARAHRPNSRKAERAQIQIPAAFHKVTDNPFARPDDLAEFRVGKCNCERQFKEKERALKGGCLNLKEYSNKSFWMHDRPITRAEVLKSSQEVILSPAPVKRDPSAAVAPSPAELKASEVLRKRLLPVTITPRGSVISSARPESAQLQREASSRLSATPSPSRITKAVPADVFGNESLESRIAQSAPSNSKPRRCQSAAGQRLYNSDKQKAAKAASSPCRWRQEKMLKGSDPNLTPNSNKYCEHGPWGVGDPRNHEAVSFTIPTAGMRPKSAWVVRSTNTDFVSTQRTSPAPSPGDRVRILESAKARRASHKLAVAHRKKMAEQQTRERQLNITMARDSKMNDAMTRVAQKRWLGLCEFQVRHKFWLQQLKEERARQELVVKQNVAVTTISRLWRRRVRKKVAARTRKAIYTIRAYTFKLYINLKIKRKKKLAQEVLAMLKEVGSMYTLARKFARVRYNVVQIQRWWAGRSTWLLIKLRQAQRAWEAFEAQKRAGLRRRELLECVAVPAELRDALLLGEIHARRKVFVVDFGCWSQGVIPMHNYEDEDTQVAAVRESLGSTTKAQMQIVLERWKPSLSLEFTPAQIEILVLEAERIMAANKAADKERLRREKANERLRWEQEAEAAASGA